MSVAQSVLSGKAVENRDGAPVGSARTRGNAGDPSRSVSDRGATPDNMPPSKLQTGGEDTLELGLGVEWKGWGNLAERLKECKENAQKAGGVGAFTHENVVFTVDSHGFRTGGGKGPYFSFSLGYSGISLAMQDLEAPAGESPNVRVQLGSLVLMEHGLEACWRVVQELIARLGGVILWDKLTRVDMCVDLLLDVETFAQLKRDGCYICRGKTGGEFTNGTRVETMYFGRDQVVCRIYDKLAECRKDKRKLAVLQEKRWGCLPEFATRVEFQVRRDFLKSVGGGSMSEYLVNRAGIAYYLCNWLRFTEEPVERNHTDRAVTCGTWAGVLQAFDRWTGGALQPVARKTPFAHDASGLLDMIGGCAISALCMLSDGGSLYDSAELEERVASLARLAVRRMKDTDKAQLRTALRWHRGGPSALSTVETAGVSA